MADPAPAAVPATPITRTYSCALGHAFTINGEWTTFAVTSPAADGAPSSRSYNYCMDCFGAWAVRQWPLRCDVVDAKS